MEALNETSTIGCDDGGTRSFRCATSSGTVAGFGLVGCLSCAAAGAAAWPGAAWFCAFKGRCATVRINEPRKAITAKEEKVREIFFMFITPVCCRVCEPRIRQRLTTG